MSDNQSSLADSNVIELPTPYKVRLHTAEDVRVEMGRVYREMRGKTLDTSSGCKLIYALGQIGKMIEVSMIENRIERLEKTVDS
jgi:hypothetical protein